MAPADENLRHGVAAVSLRLHLCACVHIHEHVDLLEGSTFALQQRLGADTVRTDRCGVDGDLRHRLRAGTGRSYITRGSGRATRAIVNTNTFSAPPRFRARAHASI